MGALLTAGETMGVAVTQPGDPLRTARSLRLSTAGAESTVAIGLRRLGHDAIWVGVVGADELGARVRRDLAAEGVGTQFVRTCPGHPTGFMIRELRAAEHTRVSYYRSGSAGAQLCPADIEAAMTASTRPDIVHLTGITPALSDSCAQAVRRAAALARSAGALVSFDVNYRATLPGSSSSAAFAASLLPDVDILFAGDDELAILFPGQNGQPARGAEPGGEQAARDLLARGPSEVVVKQGRSGALAVTSAGGHAACGALPVSVADAVGAGDSFTAGYLAARLDGLGLAGRLQWGTIAAACTVGAHGDWEGLPTRADLSQRGAGPVTIR